MATTTDPIRVRLTSNRTLRIVIDDEGRARVPFEILGLFSTNLRRNANRLLIGKTRSICMVKHERYLSRDEIMVARKAMIYLRDKDLTEILAAMDQAEKASAEDRQTIEPDDDPE